MVLRKMFGPKNEDLTGGSSRLLNHELYYLNFSSDIIRGDQITQDEVCGTCGVNTSEVHASFW